MDPFDPHLIDALARRLTGIAEIIRALNRKR
jgi:hypothetical protein